MEKSVEETLKEFLKIKKQYFSEMAYAHDNDFDFGHMDWVGGYKSLPTFATETFIFFKINRFGDRIFGVGRDFYVKNRIYLFEVKVYPYDNRDDPPPRGHLIVGVELFVDIKFKKLESKYRNPVSISGVETSMPFRGQGFGKVLYQLLMSGYGCSLIGDTDQYINARRLWFSLSHNPDINVDIINIYDHKLENNIKNIKLKDIYDDRIWMSIEDYMDMQIGIKEKDENRMKIAEEMRLIAYSNKIPKDVNILKEINFEIYPEISSNYNKRMKGIQK